MTRQRDLIAEFVASHAKVSALELIRVAEFHRIYVAWMVQRGDALEIVSARRFNWILAKDHGWRRGRRGGHNLWLNVELRETPRPAMGG